jgi:hypothetical protein
VQLTAATHALRRRPRTLQRCARARACVRVRVCVWAPARRRPLSGCSMHTNPLSSGAA